jgi:glyoxylase-like metal-dependent hydrolase (beta-lactamase superfamily II)
MEPIELAPKLILIKQGTHRFDYINSDGVIARYHQVTSSVTLFLGDEPTIIDSGARIFHKEIKERINQYIDPLKIKCFIATHYHHDHIDNTDIFKHARRILDHGCVTPEGVMTVYDDVSKIPAPEGVEIFATPGHVKNHISVKITIDDTRYVCSGDAVRMDVLSGEFKPDYMDEEYIRSARRVFNEADVIIPGHGEIIKVDMNNLPMLIK